MWLTRTGVEHRMWNWGSTQVGSPILYDSATELSTRLLFNFLVTKVSDVRIREGNRWVNKISAPVHPFIFHLYPASNCLICFHQKERRQDLDLYKVTRFCFCLKKGRTRFCIYFLFLTLVRWWKSSYFELITVSSLFYWFSWILLKL